MSVRSAGASQEYLHERSIASHLDPLRLAEDCLEQDEAFWLYGNDDSTSLAIGTIGEVVAADDRIEAVWNGQILSSDTLTDPFIQTRDLLDNLPIRNWKAFGHINFDVAGYYYPYNLRTPSPQLRFVIPKTLIEIKPLVTNIKSFEDPGGIIYDLSKMWSTHPHGKPNAPTPSTADKNTYMEGVAEIVRDIKAGYLAKAILSRCVHLDGSIDLFSTYDAVRKANPAARTYAFRQEGLSGVGSSPELLMQTKKGLILTNPLAGTRPRGATKQEDRAMKKELATNAKEIKEHAMSVQLAEQELQRICQVGSVSINEFMRPVPFRTVWHLGSSVIGQLAEGRTLWNGLQELFPGVTVSGIDKQTAIEKIASLETEPRGPYAGSLGWIDSDGSSDLAIALRSAFEDKYGVTIRAGAGIVGESIPELEYEETVYKMRTIQEQLVLQRRLLLRF